jgi:hypothetical protein
MTVLSLPERTLGAYLHCAQCALSLAESGRLADGYSLLLVGWEAARQAEEDQIPWGRPLAGCYEQALDTYCRLYGVRE